MAHRRIQILHASERNAGSGGLGEHLQEGEHHLRLKIMLIVDLQQFLNQRRHVLRGHGVVYGMKESRLFHELLHLGMEFGILVRGNITEVVFLLTHYDSFFHPCGIRAWQCRIRRMFIFCKVNAKLPK